MIAAPPSRDLTQPDKFSSKEFREGLKLSNFKLDEFPLLQLLFEIFYLIFTRGSAPCFKSLAPVCRRLKFPTIFSSLWCRDAKKMSYAKLQNLKTHQTILLCIFLIVLFEDKTHKHREHKVLETFILSKNFYTQTHTQCRSPRPWPEDRRTGHILTDIYGTVVVPCFLFLFVLF